MLRKSCIFKKIAAYTLAFAMIAGTVQSTSLVTVVSNAAKKATLKTKSANIQTGKKKVIVIKNKAKGASYTYKSSAKKVAVVSKKGVITAKKAGLAKVTVSEKLRKAKKARKVGVVKVKVTAKNAQTVSQSPASNVPVNTVAPLQNSSSAPSQTPTQTSTQTPAATNTPDPTPEPTKDAYTKTVLSVTYDDGQLESVKGSTCTVDMQYFTGDVTGDYFTGKIIKNSSDVKKTYKDGKIEHCQRYQIEGQDSNGKSSKIFIQDISIKADDKMVITKPVIFTDNEELKWMESADIEGRIVIGEDGLRTATYVWNEESTEEPAIPTPVVPDDTRTYDKEIFTFYIDTSKGSDEVAGTRGTATSIRFAAEGKCDNFNGKTVADSWDTRFKVAGRTESLSARYILDGTDINGDPCKIYVENNGIDRGNNGGMVTEPVIITDSPVYAWVENAPLHGTVSWEAGLTIHMWTTSTDN